MLCVTGCGGVRSVDLQIVLVGGVGGVRVVGELGELCELQVVWV